MSIYLLIIKNDSSVFQKGDIISINETTYFGKSIEGNLKFHTLEVSDMVMSEGYLLLEPLLNIVDVNQPVVRARCMSVNINLLLSHKRINKDFLTQNLVVKNVNVDTQIKEVLV